MLQSKWAWTLHLDQQVIISRVTGLRPAADRLWGWTWDKASVTNSILTHGNVVGKYPVQVGSKGCAKQARTVSLHDTRWSVFRGTLYQTNPKPKKGETEKTVEPLAGSRLQGAEKFWAARKWDFTKLLRFLADQRGLIWEDEQTLAEREGKGAME